MSELLGRRFHRLFGAYMDDPWSSQWITELLMVLLRGSKTRRKYWSR